MGDSGLPHGAVRPIDRAPYACEQTPFGHARCRPVHPALVFESTTLTWADLDLQVHRLVNAAHGMGLSKGFASGLTAP